MKSRQKILDSHPRNLRLMDTSKSNAFQEKHILAAMEEFATQQIGEFLAWAEQESWFKKSWFADNKDDQWMNKTTGARMTTAELITEFNLKNPS